MAESNTGATELNEKQFSTHYLLMLTAVSAVSVVPIARWQLYGIPLAIWLLTIGVSLINKRFRFALGNLAIGLAFVLILLPAVGGAGPAARRVGCINNMRQISLALLNFEAAHGHFPPPFTTDEQGNPLHSWRVLILPYMEEVKLYEQIDLNKPWYDPHNLALADQMPGVYSCPVKREFSPRDEHTTAYVAIVGRDDRHVCVAVRNEDAVVHGCHRENSPDVDL